MSLAQKSIQDNFCTNASFAWKLTKNHHLQQIFQKIIKFIFIKCIIRRNKYGRYFASHGQKNCLILIDFRFRYNFNNRPLAVSNLDTKRWRTVGGTYSSCVSSTNSNKDNNIRFRQWRLRVWINAPQKFETAKDVDVDVYGSISGWITSVFVYNTHKCVSLRIKKTGKKRYEKYNRVA